MPGEIVLEMKDISKKFPGVLALDHANLEIQKGEVHILLGENGAGKSTLIKILAGAYSRDSGEIFFEGKKLIAQTGTDIRDKYDLSGIQPDTSSEYCGKHISWKRTIKSWFTG